jgi:hypothetical protein
MVEIHSEKRLIGYASVSTVGLLSVLPHDRSRRFEPDTDATTLVDIGVLGGNVPDDILGGQYRCHRSPPWTPRGSNIAPRKPAIDPLRTLTQVNQLAPIEPWPATTADPCNNVPGEAPPSVPSVFVEENRVCKGCHQRGFDPRRTVMIPRLSPFLFRTCRRFLRASGRWAGSARSTGGSAAMRWPDREARQPAARGPG